MDLFTSKFLPFFIYPLGLACLLLLFALIRKNWSRWNRVMVLIALIILYLASNHWVANGLARSLEWRYMPMENIPEADVILVLGGGTQPAEYPRPIVEMNGAGDRTLYAAWLYHQGYADHLLLSGGRIPWQSPANFDLETPAEEMAFIMKMLAVPEGAIWLEKDSRNTYENALFSKRVLEDQGIERIILVTSAMHMPRAIRLFEAQGLEVIPAPVDYRVVESDWVNLQEISIPQHILRLLPSADNLSLTTSTMKEYIGMLYYTLRGWE